MRISLVADVRGGIMILEHTQIFFLVSFYIFAPSYLYTRSRKEKVYTLSY